MKYREVIVTSPLLGDRKHIIGELPDGGSMSFPAEDGNPYYKQYLEWLAEGNEPLPADEEPK